ncbi:hypothetical protein C8Q76DRAFT_789005 [Earliella scabrosa]|nr:hypothetical protein C8Q76DRAFT_789005 [Earliella scabrosa]
MSYPKSCLKPASTSSTSSTLPSPRTSVSSVSSESCFPPTLEGATFNASVISDSDSSLPVPKSAIAPPPQRKSVSFSEYYELVVYRRPARPLHEQAMRAAVKWFRACADAMRIESPAHDMPGFWHDIDDR